LVEACAGQDIIVHAAAIISFDPSDHKKIFKVNIDGTTHLVNAAIKSAVKKFIYISSIAAISDLPDRADHDEFIPWDLKTNHSNYAISKHAAEMEVWRGSAEGLEIGILNPSVVLGLWDENHHSMQIFKIVREGITFYPSGSTGWVDVRDVATATQSYIEQGIVNQQIIINGHNLSYQNMINMIAAGYNLKAPSHKLSRRIALIGSRIY
jgi:nucleoside-diphosphate-sugar epimerase